jgi:ParB-like chromosome segregation protein Spo0J
VELPYHIDGPIKIDSQKLLFWPNNPRLKISDYSDFKYSEEELLNKNNQLKIYKQLIKTEHDVQKIIESMKRSGFMQEKAPIVMKVGDVDKYLVLEGNRRLAAITTLTNGSLFQVSWRIRKSLKTIPCWLFIHDSKSIPKEAAISLLVAEAHIKGQKPHTKLQQAHMLYNAFEGFLIEETGNRTFRNQTDVLKRSANFFGMNLKEFSKEIAIVRLHTQLTNAGYQVSQKAYERIRWVVETPGLFGEHFGYKSKDYSLTDEGLEKFYDIFVARNAKVKNPTLFRKFKAVIKNRGGKDIETIRAEEGRLEEIYQLVKDGEAEKEFINGLIAIEKKIEELRVATYRESDEENMAINRISQLVEKKLLRLIDRDNRPKTTKTNTIKISPTETIKPNTIETIKRFRKPPNSVNEAMLLDESYLDANIITVIKSRPNQSCVRAKVPTYLLQKWGIRTSGIPRRRFCEFVDKKIHILDKDNLVQVYWAKNERVRVLSKW